MHVGFTGTRNGLTPGQQDSLFALLRRLRDENGARVLHHGDCVGADLEAHRAACALRYRVVVHPPILALMRAYCDAEDIRDKKDYLARNQDIVRECDCLVACPGEQVEKLRSGTWSTVRSARKAGKVVHVVYPDGTVTTEG